MDGPNSLLARFSFRACLLSRRSEELSPDDANTKICRIAIWRSPVTPSAKGHGCTPRGATVPGKGTRQPLRSARFLPVPFSRGPEYGRNVFRGWERRDASR